MPLGSSSDAPVVRPGPKVRIRRDRTLAARLGLGDWDAPATVISVGQPAREDGRPGNGEYGPDCDGHSCPASAEAWRDDRGTEDDCDQHASDEDIVAAQHDGFNRS